MCINTDSIALTCFYPEQEQLGCLMHLASRRQMPRPTETSDLRLQSEVDFAPKTHKHTPPLGAPTQD